jgi:phage shock protein E
MSIQEMVQNGTVVDVRTHAEFMGGHVEGAINIPLQELMARVDEFKLLKAPVVLCCASGNRSGMATQVLQTQGVDCVNGGSWLEVNYYKTQVA